MLATILLLPAIALAAVVPDSDLQSQDSLRRAVSVVSPDLTCGTLLAGANKGYTCPSDTPCCSQYGYCGTGDSFCLTTGGCQTRFSNTTSSCTAPRSGTTVSIDGTCGTTGAGKSGYRCPTGSTMGCCSAAGYCGNTTDHCDTAKGCQSGFGTCARSTGKRSRGLWE
ncbi:carbohydrate-binding module family 18 protein [Rhypophila decipiens]|uniref:Carbohydrate-binding module family 18 protein n=1 Tax=Rhypophila decipiens TaxID=261697 RepID=A0AAN6Y9U0_9PEZI|nr:carbohydrate-binding module family 18 protein [Rhypophila decipiens]